MLWNLIVRVPALLFALSIHEWAHAFAAYRYGDPTAKNEGRLSWNPIAHIDWYGLIPIVMGLPFGWAKPVPVNPYRLENPAVAMPVIAAAGPIANLLQMFVGCVVWYGLSQATLHYGLGVPQLIVDFCLFYIVINWGLAFFNLFPLFPLDGGKVVTLLMPAETAARYEATFYRMGFMPLMVLILGNMATGGAIFGFWFGLWSPLGQPILNLFGVPLQLSHLF